MNFQNLAKTARLYARSEAMVAEIMLRAFGRRMTFTIIAILAGVMGLAFLNVAVYVYLLSLWGPVWTPLLIGLANFVIAGLAIVVAGVTHPGPELAMAKELRDTASRNLEEEFHAGSPIGGLAGALGGRSESNLINLLLPAVISIVGALGRRKPAPKK